METYNPKEGVYCEARSSLFALSSASFPSACTARVPETGSAFPDLLARPSECPLRFLRRQTQPPATLFFSQFRLSNGLNTIPQIKDDSGGTLPLNAKLPRQKLEPRSDLPSSS